MIRIDKFIPGGEALATEESGKKIFLWNALPGEEVIEYQFTKQKSHFSEAIAQSIGSPSPHRVAPKDSCFLSTSPWQILDYDYELSVKQDLVVELFREHQITIPRPPIFTDHRDYFYRNKMEYALYWDHDTGSISLAFHERGSHRKIPITSSSIERPEIFAAATKIVADLNARHEEARKYQSLLLRCNQAGEVSGGLLENGKSHPVFPQLTDEILGHTYSYSPNGFFQINLPVYEMALTEIKKHIVTEDVLDLYSGVGTIGLSVASNKNLTLVEVNKSAYGELVKNCEMMHSGRVVSLEGDPHEPERVGEDKGRQDPPSIRPVLSKSEDVLDFITSGHTVILDPPRAGCDSKLLDKLLEKLPPKIIYLSCNPATEARDVKILLEKYHIEDVKIFNFFPHTPHIENLIVLSL
ncbi:class I SAM-dependent RNA methyltransferase [Candidatus Saccharibacteria bacterium]|nr:class I SAM-dependent RNA methyltransferase [Candidatus Saccharibacteria bacterium]